MQCPIFCCPPFPGLPPTHRLLVQDFEISEQTKRFPIAVQLLQVTFLESNNLASAGSYLSFLRTANPCGQLGRLKQASGRYRLSQVESGEISLLIFLCILYPPSQFKRKRKIFVAKASTRRTLRTVILSPSSLSSSVNTPLRRWGGGQEPMWYL